MATTQDQSAAARLNAILVFEADDGSAQHRFCTAAEATDHLDKAAASFSGGSMFINEELGAEMVYAVSPDLRARVDEAKRKLKFEMAIRDALNRHGVPADRQLRISIKKAIDELRETVLRPLC